MIRQVLGAAVSKGASVLDRLDRHFNDEDEDTKLDDDDDDDDELDDRKSEEEVRRQEEHDRTKFFFFFFFFQELDHVAEEDERYVALRRRNGKLRKMISHLEEALANERAVCAETSEKLATAVSDSGTIDDLVEEYNKLSSEAQAQAERDAAKIAAALNRNEELETKLKVYEAQILSLTDQDNNEVMKLVASGALANDGARLFAALRAAKARQFELELELNDANRRLGDPKCEHPDEEDSRAQLDAKHRADLDELRQRLEAKRAADLDELRLRLEAKSAADLDELEAKHREELREKELGEDTATEARRERDAFRSETERLSTQLAATEKRLLEVEASGVETRREARAEAQREFRGQIAAIERERDEMAARARDERERRRNLHNKLVEARGNIRVYCRCRPTRDETGASFASFPSDDEILVRRDADGYEESRFEFDGVFAPGSTQTAVFERAVEDLVVSALDGFSVCIFAYGQTGSGKTHTMSGVPGDRGVNFRAIELLFETAVAGDLDYSLELSILEIYNETLRDLLAKQQQHKTKLEIQTASGHCEVPGLERHAVASVDDVEALISRGASNRAVGAHDVNAQSSRSHQIVTLYVKATNSNVAAKLHLVDLAGSERLAKTDASGDRLKEAQNINKSLSALGDVIAALSSGQRRTHVPFRNSKLTFLLQDSLSGDSKALMFVNVSPAPADVPETLCSLKFAARCRDTALGKARRNTTGSASSTHSPQRSRLSQSTSASRAQHTPHKLPTSPQKNADL
ncbi:hypothetical protein CTAYLR_000875 [Chrysophaeum taylorii]|uniref:Kinesin-like protein n=1 Tax=Chrysophaeum taylorii TaxID=2483200 RepID=A0AAD7UR50_9STRA|nr:hypothetical protein CTAYLR_000875 [Chrysophaeum taylorii]